MQRILFRNRRRLRGRRFGPQSLEPYALGLVSRSSRVLVHSPTRIAGGYHEVRRLKNRDEIMLPRENRRISGIVARTPKVRRRRRSAREMRRGECSMCSSTGCG